MSLSLRAAAALVFLALLSPEGLALRSSPKKKAVHGKHHKAHHRHQKAAAPVAAAAEEQKSQATDKAQFGHIQKELVEAWKHKTHMAKLRQTLEAEQKLLSSQQSLVESDVDDASDSAVQQQAAATKNMINDAKVLLYKSRQDALKQTRAALKEAYQIKKTTEHDIETSNLAIQKATKAKEEADKKIKSIATVIHAATEEAKFFFNQEVPDVHEEKASTKSSSTPVKKAKESENLVKEQESAKPQPKKTERKQEQTESTTEDDIEEEGPVEEEKKTVSVAKKQEPANPQPKKVELKEKVKEKHDSTVLAKEEKASTKSSSTLVKKAKESENIVKEQELATPQPKETQSKQEQTESTTEDDIEETAQEKHDYTMFAKLATKMNADDSLKGKAMIWDEDE